MSSAFVYSSSIVYVVIVRVLIATQHFLKSSALVENMYSAMSHGDRYVSVRIRTRTCGANITYRTLPFLSKVKRTHSPQVAPSEIVEA